MAAPAPDPAALATDDAAPGGMTHPDWRALTDALAMFRVGLAIRLAMLAIGLGGVTWAMAARTIDPTLSLAQILPLIDVGVSVVMAIAMFRLAAAVPPETRALGAAVAAGVAFGFSAVVETLEYSLIHGVPQLASNIVDPMRKLRWLHAVIDVSQLVGLAILALALRNIAAAVDARRLRGRASGMLGWLSVAAIATAGSHILPGRGGSTLVVAITVLCMTMLGMLLYLALVRDLVGRVRTRVPELPEARVTRGAQAP